jgi:hypothetical protein
LKTRAKYTEGWQATVSVKFLWSLQPKSTQKTTVNFCDFLAWISNLGSEPMYCNFLIWTHLHGTFLVEKMKMLRFKERVVSLKGEYHEILNPLFMY